MTTVAVVGGGAAGALTAIHLGRIWPDAGDLQVILYDDGARPGRGVAYSTTDPRHLLNVPVGRMSAVDDEPDHFLRWLRGRDPEVGADDFASRTSYGDYLADTLADHAPGAGLVVRRSRVSDVMRSGRRFRVTHDGGIDAVDAVVLALGHAPPSRLSGVVAPDAEGYVADPWRTDALREIEDRTCPGDTVLTIGAGLTAVDVALSVTARGRRVVAISRHGLLPSRHRLPLPEPDAPEADLPSAPLTVDTLERWVRDHVDAAGRRGVGWRAAIDGLRPVTPQLWAALTPDERRRFLDGPARQWEVLRHRMAPQVADEIDRLLAARTLTVIQADVVAAVGEERRWRVSIRRDGLAETLPVAAVVNCTGPTCDIERYPNGFGRRLLARGLITADPLRLGIRTTVDGRVIDGDGLVDRRLLTLGALRRGSLYESTAVPELRQQAASVATLLAAELSVRRPHRAYRGGAEAATGLAV